MVDNLSRYRQLRNKYHIFDYRSYHYQVKNDTLHILFEFNIDREISFRPTYTIPLDQSMIAHKTGSFPDNIIFHIGMIELISYWKCCCPALLKVSCGRLDETAAAWWKKIYFNGLGEFFHTNGIIPDYSTFLNIQSEGTEIKPVEDVLMNDAILVPIGGGKDSAVTLDLLKDRYKAVPFLLNPKPAMKRTVISSGLNPGNSIVFQRHLDPKLLKMNDEGFLNGHTPFSALLAFVSLLAGWLACIPDIVLSNESSANEPTIPGTNINHQWSKTFEFENLFREYVNRNISQQLNYFSFLRPLNELQIALIFSRLTNHHHTFRSCNVGSKTDVWCGKCPKCLFTFIILSPFLPSEEVTQIFGRDLLQDEELIPVLDQLTGNAREKPFECIGTVNEVNEALRLVIRKNKGKTLPVLLKHYKTTTNEKQTFIHEGSIQIENVPSAGHHLSGELISIIEKALQHG